MALENITLGNIKRSAFNSVFSNLGRMSRLSPRAREAATKVRVTKNIRYGSLPQQSLDIVRPKKPGTYPVLIYIHGGGFTLCSKESHAGLAKIYAWQDHVVFNIDYRLAPQHKYPAAHEDAMLAYAWVLKHAAEYGGDTSRIAVAGESAGGTLTASVALACCTERPEPWAKALWELNHPPTIISPICPLLETNNFQRLAAKGRLVHNALRDINRAYLGGVEGSTALADPITEFQKLVDNPPARPLPTMFLACGKADPIYDDTTRLESTLKALNSPHEAHYYEGEPHAFQALFWRAAAKDYWKKHIAFLRKHLHQGA